MIKHGKKITIFLIDGDPNGRMACELSNWTGKAYKIPRIHIKDCADREDLIKPGIYFLFGQNEEGNNYAYIGESENVLKRLKEHLSTRDFWNEAIIFISKDENLNKAHIKYLENQLTEIAKSAKRYGLENENTPTKSSISEADKAEMGEFLENIKLLTNTLGHKIFEEKREQNINTPTDESVVFILKGARGADAQGIPTSEGFTVFKGAKMSIDTQKSTSPYTIKKREELIKAKIIEEKEGNYVFLEDYIFRSSSAASDAIMGGSTSGPITWKTIQGITLKEYESQINQITDNNN